MRELVEMWDERMRSDLHPGLELPAQARASGSVLREPATEADIEAAETRLGVRFPASYRAFLAISNGAFASSAGPAYSNCVDGGFLPVELVQWAAIANAFLVDLWLGLPQPNHAAIGPPSPGSEPVEVRLFGPLDRGLLISGGQDVFLDVLVPVEGEAEWQVWQFHHDGAAAYRSFADLLRWQLSRPVDRPPTGEELSSIIERIRHGEIQLSYRLEGTDDPRLFDLAITILEDEQIFEKLAERYAENGPDVAPRLAENARILCAARMLRSLRRPEAVQPLRAAYRRASDTGSRLNALAAMVECGAPDTDQLIHDAANDQNASVRRWAVFRLGEQDPVDLDVLRRATDDEEWIVRHSAAVALVEHQPPDLPSLLRKAAKDLHSRKWALRTLIQHEPSTALATLETAVTDPDLETRRWAIGELVDRRAPGAIERLQAAAADQRTDKDTTSLRKWAKRRLEQPDLARD
jgi:HEAT repeat protein